MHKHEQLHITAEDQSHLTTDIGLDDLALTSNWMRQTGWATTFAATDRLLLLMLAERPAVGSYRLALGQYGETEMYSSSDDEWRLQAVGDAVDCFFDQCEDTAPNTDHSIRCWLRSQVPGRPYKAPFELPGRASTTTKYRGYWKRLLYFVFRLYRLDQAVQENYLRFRLLCRQCKAVEEAWTALQLDSACLEVHSSGPDTPSSKQNHNSISSTSPSSVVESGIFDIANDLNFIDGDTSDGEQESLAESDSDKDSDTYSTNGDTAYAQDSMDDDQGKL